MHMPKYRAVKSENQAAWVLQCGQVNLGGRVDGWVGFKHQVKHTGSELKADLLQATLKRLGVGSAKAAYGPPFRLVKGIHGQVFLVPLVTDTRIVLVTGRVVPLRGA